MEQEKTIRDLLYEAVMEQVGRVFEAHVSIPADRPGERRMMAGPVYYHTDEQAIVALAGAMKSFAQALASALEQIEFPPEVDRELLHFWRDHALPDLKKATSGRDLATNMAHMVADTLEWAVRQTFKPTEAE